MPKLKTNSYMQTHSEVSQVTFYHEMKPKIYKHPFTVITRNKNGANVPLVKRGVFHSCMVSGCCLK